MSIERTALQKTGMSNARVDLFAERIMKNTIICNAISLFLFTILFILFIFSIMLTKMKRMSMI